MTAAAMPGFDLSALQGISPQQLAVIAQLFQAGQLPLPPPAPTQTTPQVTSTPTQADPPLAQNEKDATLTQAPGAAEVMNVDREDGELEDGEVDDVPNASGFLRTPPNGPRQKIDPKRPSYNDTRRSSHQVMEQPSAHASAEAGILQVRSASSAARPPVVSSEPQVNGSATVPIRPRKDAAAKAFVLEMYRNGYTYDQISKEVTDVQLLRRMYQQLELPITSSSPALAPNGTVQATKKPAAAKAPAKPANPQDRSAYLAKLQAAKNKKLEANKPSATPPPALAPAASAQLEPVLTPPTVQSSASGSPGQAAASSLPPARPVGLTKDKNELIKQRLEKLKAEQAAKKMAQEAAAAALAQSSSSPALAPSVGLGTGLVEAAARAEGEATTSAALLSPATQSAGTVQPLPPSPASSPSMNRGVGLPGLFTIFPPPSSPLKPSQSAMTAVNPRTLLTDRPSASRTQSSSNATTLFAQNGHATSAHQHPIVQERQTQSDDRCVIEVSSDEDDGDEMDTDSSDEDATARTPQQPVSRTGSVYESTRNVHRPKLSTSSAPQTPTAGTPNNDLKRKLEEIANYKRQIAEAERKRQRMSKERAQAALSVNAGGQQEAARPSSAAEQQTVASLPTAEDGLAQPSNAEDPATPNPAISLGMEAEGSGAPLQFDMSAEANDSSTTIAAEPLDGTRSTPDVIDDEDDEDLYGDAPEAGANTISTEPNANSQATTISLPPDLAMADVLIESADSQYNADAIDDDNDDFYEPQLEAHADTAPLPTNTAMDVDGEDDGGEDDLDHNYAPPEPPHTALGAEQPPLPDSNAAIAKLKEDSDDSMNTSDVSSTDSDDSDAESEFEPAPATEPVSLSEAAATYNEEQVPETFDGVDAVDSEDVHPDDADLAPELQPSSEERTVPVPSVSLSSPGSRLGEDY